MHCLTAWGQWAVELLQCTAPLPGGIGQCNFCNALVGGCAREGDGGAVSSAAERHRAADRTEERPGLAKVGRGARGARGVGGGAVSGGARTPLGGAALPGGSGQRNSCTALPHCPGAVGSGTPATHCLTAWEQWAVQLLQRTASLPGDTGQCNSCNGWSECSAGPVGMYYWAHRPGGMGSPTQGVVGASFKAYGGPSSSENRAHRPGGDGESRPGGGRSLLQGPWGGVIR